MRRLYVVCIVAFLTEPFLAFCSIILPSANTYLIAMAPLRGSVAATHGMLEDATFNVLAATCGKLENKLSYLNAHTCPTPQHNSWRTIVYLHVLRSRLTSWRIGRPLRLLACTPLLGIFSLCSVTLRMKFRNGPHSPKQPALEMFLFLPDVAEHFVLPGIPTVVVLDRLTRS